MWIQQIYSIIDAVFSGKIETRLLFAIYAAYLQCMWLYVLLKNISKKKNLIDGVFNINTEF